MGYNKFGEPLGINRNIHITMTIPFLDIYPRETSADVPQAKSLIMCITVLFLISKNCNNPNVH